MRGGYELFLFTVACVDIQIYTHSQDKKVIACDRKITVIISKFVML